MSAKKQAVDPETFADYAYQVLLDAAGAVQSSKDLKEIRSILAGLGLSKKAMREHEELCDALNSDECNS